MLVLLLLLSLAAQQGEGCEEGAFPLHGAG
jgi:hypothetical protein